MLEEEPLRLRLGCLHCHVYTDHPSTKRFEYCHEYKMETLFFDNFRKNAPACSIKIEFLTLECYGLSITLLKIAGILELISLQDPDKIRKILTRNNASCPECVSSSKILTNLRRMIEN